VFRVPRPEVILKVLGEISAASFRAVVCVKHFLTGLFVADELVSFDLGALLGAVLGKFFVEVRTFCFESFFFQLKIFAIV